MIEVRVPEGRGPEIVISYAGDPAVTYEVSEAGTVQVQEGRHLSEFLAAVAGSVVVGPAEVPVEPAAPTSTERGARAQEG